MEFASGLVPSPAFGPQIEYVGLGEELGHESVIDRAGLFQTNGFLKLPDRRFRTWPHYTIHRAGFEPLIEKIDLHRPDVQIGHVSGSVPVKEML